jgi:outer membrane protein assembly factor BamB
LRTRFLLLCAVIVVAAALLFHWSRVAKRTPQVHAEVGTIKWATSIDRLAVFYTSPILGNDETLYVATGDGRVFAIDPSSEVRWQYRLGPDTLIDGGLVQDDQKNLYFTTMDKVFSLSPAGLKRWEASCSPAKKAFGNRGATFDETSVYTSCGDNFAALDKASGNVLWTQPAFDTDSSPVLLPDENLAFVRERRIVIANRDGATISSFPFAPAPPLGSIEALNPESDPYIDTPIAVGTDGTLYAGSRYRSFAALGRGNTVRWTFDAGAQLGFRTSPVIASDGTIIVLTAQATVLAIAPGGKLMWSFPLTRTPNGHGQSPPVLGDDGTIYALADRKLVALSAEGKPVWNLAVGGTTIGSPALAADGTLYFATTDGVIYAVQTASRGLMKSAWPKYQHDSSNSGRAPQTEGR